MAELTTDEMRKMMKFTAVTIMICGMTALAGCVSSGNQTLKDETQASIGAKLTEGKTTKAQVQQNFGAPISTTFNDNAEEVWTYSLSNMQAGAENFIPYVGMFGGTAKGTEKRLIILFDRNNVVKRYSMTESKVESRTGIFNQ